MVLPNQTSVIGQAKAIEAQAMLNQVYGLEKVISTDIQNIQAV